ncbi:discoidin domain-containing protein [Paremcibacter congregatus]|uniref:galactose-binding domain-containing protein n=1 Tax=Paremcibacter congregatus TaxID=2043170 RepID=UPI0030EB318D|tara:strand:- start:2979 stop:3554 length:576 start_codon:yes stop_codon:yes gene_type:complete
MFIKTLISAALLSVATLVPAQALPAINQALTGTASQSSIYNPQASASQADHAIDGNTSGQWTGGAANSLNHTANEFQAWWEVDLGAMIDIDDIVIWNRTDCCANRLNNFSVFLDGALIGAYNQQNGPAPTFSLNNVGLTGQVVRVQLNDTNYLHLAEVQVFGTVASVPAPGALGLMGLGLLGLGLVARRRS